MDYRSFSIDCESVFTVSMHGNKESPKCVLGMRTTHLNWDRTKYAMLLNKSKKHVEQMST